MDVEERAKKYAEGKALKALESITSAIEKAYAVGFYDGQRYYENQDFEAAQEVTYVDLGLPSKTLWSLQYLTKESGIVKLPYVEAMKFKIPTVEQFEELWYECHKSFISKSGSKCVKLTGKSGNHILLKYLKIEDMPSADYDYGSFFFWLKDKYEEDLYEIDHFCACIKETQNLTLPNVNTIFMGLKLPIMLVSKR